MTCQERSAISEFLKCIIMLSYLNFANKITPPCSEPARPRREILIYPLDSVTKLHGINVLVLHICAVELTYPLAMLIRTMVTTCHWQTCWCEHWVVPRFKKKIQSRPAELSRSSFDPTFAESDRTNRGQSGPAVYRETQHTANGNSHTARDNRPRRFVICSSVLGVVDGARRLNSNILL